ncbi:hypothetical protein ACP76Z_10105 [Vibrio cholerae]
MMVEYVGDDPSELYDMLLLTINYGNLSGIDFSREIFNKNKDIIVDYKKGTINHRGITGGFLGKTFAQVAAILYQKSIEELSYIELLSTKNALESIGIDTVYPYGSMDNIKASLFLRVNNNLSKRLLPEEVGIGSEPFIIDELLARNNQLTMFNFSNALDKLTEDIYSNANLYRSDNVVRLYADHNYTGHYIDIENSTKFLHGFNDTLSSWTIPHGWSVRFYEHGDYQGRYWTRDASGNESGFNDVISSIEILKKTSGIKGSLIRNELESLKNSYREIDKFQVIVGYENETPIYALPLTDELFAKAQLYSYGLDANFVDKHWKSYLKKGRLSLIPGVRVGKDILKKDAAALGGDVTTKGAQDLWRRKYQEISQVMAKYIATLISFKAKLEGKESWDIQSENKNRSVRFNFGFGITYYNMGNNGKAHSRYENIPTQSWVMTGKDISYSVTTPGDLLSLFSLNNFKVIEPIDFNSGSNNYPLYQLMNSDYADKCSYYQDGWYPRWNVCDTKFITRNKKSYNTKDIMSYGWQEFLNFKMNDLKTVQTDRDIAYQVLMAILPVWGTVEDIKSGDAGMATLGVLGDVMFFLPIAKSVSSIGKLSAKAASSKLLPRNVKFVRNVIGLNKQGKYSLTSSQADRAFYKLKIQGKLKELPKVILNELNPIAGLNQLVVTGTSKLYKKYSSRVSIPKKNIIGDNSVVFYDDLKFKSEVFSVSYLDDGYLIINNQYRAVYIDGNYYRVEYDPILRANFIYEQNSGRRIEIIKDKNGNWSIKEINNGICPLVSLMNNTKVCHFTNIDDALISMGFDPKTRTASGLLELINGRYGPDIKEYLLKLNSSLSLNYNIDIDTLNWVFDTIENSGMSRYAFTPFVKNTDAIMYDMLGKFYNNNMSIKPVFLNKSQYKKLKKTLDSDKELIINVISEQRKINLNEAQQLFDEFYASVTKDPIFGLDSITHDRPVIHVVGHGDAGDEVIYPGDASHYFYAFELADMLKNKGLKPDSIIKLDFCWSACSLKPSDYSKTEVLTRMNKGDYTPLFGDIDDSFLGEFAKELTAMYPTFRGPIIGYVGTVLNTIQDNVLTLANTQGRFHAVEMNFSDGKFFFKKEDAEVIYGSYKNK